MNNVKLLLIPILLAACVGDGAPLVEPVDESDTSAIVQEEVAVIELDDGNIRFLVDVDGEEAGTVTVVELVGPDKSGTLRIDEQDLSPLELFLEHTPADTPVPTALIVEETDSTILARLGDRQEVDFLVEPVDSIFEFPPTIARATAAQMCAAGTTSSAFASQICSLDDHWTKNFCHNGTWYGVTDETGSSHKSEWIRSRTLACGANGRVKQSYRGAFGWRTSSTTTIPSGKIIRVTKKGGIKRQRKAYHSRTSSGFVRATTDFNRFPF